ncbi:uncharacterized protein EDB91DRAFT_1077729 [Suillus paluster]|uniref:uncharacterized protein n=1 Tax=Suillus paluster TaxID=48578 RepID=UPI001B887223|nr:uncharacterized protein EDB91DRAFT_1077729 [Suillus paluster]KAG1752294.1 hypothetical protein EDB91DRAFT_1077729 [Suillus paluster]
MQGAVTRPILQRGMVKAISFNAANRSEAMAVLKYYLNNTTAQELYTRIGTALSDPMLLSTDVENFLSALEGIGIVTSSAHAAVNDNVVRHCLRCHQPYMERDNRARSCNILHTLQMPARPEVVGQAPKVRAICCGADLSIEVATKTLHFTGRHTTSVQNVAYNTTNVKTCAEMGCAGNAAVITKGA